MTESRIAHWSCLAALAVLLLARAGFSAEDSLPPLVDGKVPQDLDELWGHYDPHKEPLETTVVREWTEGAVTCRYVVFSIGTFKGKVSRMAAFYAFPTGAKERLPGLLDLHGGGQRAGLTPVIFMAQNGYAGLSINWGGNPMEGMKEGEPNTDWGALDATQKHNDHYGTMKPDAKTLDAVESPRNNNWFLLVLAARRGLTFLERQPEVDAQRLGVTGHSMGGKLTTDLAGIDPRVKVAVPSCGGCGSTPGKVLSVPSSGLRSDESALHLETIDDCAYIPRIRCPILFLSPTNDFHAPLDTMAENWKQIGSKDLHYAISPHFNHRHLAEFNVSEYLLFEQYLKGGPPLPATPVLEVKLNTPDGIPVATLRPDRAAEATRACIYYSVDPHVLTRFWRDAEAKREGDAWVARCPVMSGDQPLYVMASVYYPLKQTFRRYQWLGFDHVQEFAISSTMITRLPADLKRAGVKATDTAEAMIDDFSREWQDWARLEWGNPYVWDATTRKIKDPKWRGPDGAQLAIDVKAPKDCTLVVRVRQNDWGAFPDKPSGEYAAAHSIKGSPDWQTLTFALRDFRPAQEGTKGPLANWSYVTELSLCGSAEVIRDGEKIRLGGQAWNEPRQFRNFRWIDGCTSSATIGQSSSRRKGGPGDAVGLQRSGRSLVLALAAAPVQSTAEAGPSHDQRPIARVDLMPRLPDPLVVRDWRHVARQYYELVLDPDTRLDGKPLVTIQADPPAFDIASWVGGKPDDEAFTCLSAVIGARLVGLDPRHLHGFDYVGAAKRWFDEKNSVYRARPGQRGQPVYHSGIYGYWAGVLGLALAGQYPDDADFHRQAEATAKAFLRIARGMGCPDKPDFDVLGFNFDKGVPDGRPEPMNRLGHAPSVAWALLVGYRLTGDRAMLDCARAAMQWHIDHPGRYEVTHVMGPLVAARLNAEDGCKLDLDRVLATWFGDGDPQRTPWKITAGIRCGSVTCDGLDGAAWAGREPGFHAFTMGTLQGPAWLVPVARYDPRYAREIGRYALHAANSARLLQGFGLDWDHQDHKDWKDRWDPQGLLFYEALTSWDWGAGRRFRPYATGDPVRLGWGGPKVGPQEYEDEKRKTFSNTSRNLALYMGNHVGFLGGIVTLTDVPGILRWDCLTTDWFHAPAHPTWLVYNPYAEAKTFHADVGPRPVDLYDTVTGEYAKRGVSGAVELTLPPDGAAVFVAAPAGVPLTHDGGKTLIGGVVVDYASGEKGKP